MSHAESTWYNIIMQDQKHTRELQGTLTAKQQRFVQEYLIDFNATAAAERAGYSKKTARSKGAENLTKPDIQMAIQERIHARAERTKITADLVVQETWKNYQRCVEAEEYGAANKSLELLGRHVGAFPNKHEHAGPNGGAIPISTIRYGRHQPAKLPVVVPGGDGT